MIKQNSEGKWCLYTKDGSRVLGCHDTRAEAEAQEKAILIRSVKAAAGGTTEVKTLEGTEYVVFPVVALVEGVLQVSTAPAPELVLAEEFARAVQGWNGRPIVMGHPEIDGQKVLANEPAVLERYRFGYLFHAHVEEKKLLVEAWLDPARAAAVGANALKALERIQSGELVDVSVGVLAQTEQVSGEFKGAEYSGIWRNIMPDHLAVLDEGVPGACDVDMGCGIPRAAERKEDRPMGLKARFLELVSGFRPSQEGTSDADLRTSLEKVLYATEPAFVGVDSVYPDEQQVVYTVAPPEESYHYFRRSYTLGEDGSVTLGTEREEVKIVSTTRFEPVVAAEGQSAADTQDSAASCGCGGQVDNNSPARKDATMNRKERVAAIIASGRTCFTSEQAPLLEAAEEELITHLEQNIKKPEEKQEVQPGTEQDPEALAAEQDAAFFQRHPEVSQLIEDHKAADARKRGELLGHLKDAAKAGYTEEQLKAMSTQELERLGAVLPKPGVDYTVQGGPKSDDSTEGITSADIRAAQRARFEAARKSA